MCAERGSYGRITVRICFKAERTQARMPVLQVWAIRYYESKVLHEKAAATSAVSRGIAVFAGRHPAETPQAARGRFRSEVPQWEIATGRDPQGRLSKDTA